MNVKNHQIKLPSLGAIKMNRFLKYWMLGVVSLGLGCLSSWGEDKIIDVNMRSPFVPLPFNIDFVEHPHFYTAATVADGRVIQDSGPETEVMTAYRTADKSWAVWVRLPDQAGEFEYSKVGTDNSARIKVTEDKEHPYGYRVVIQLVKGSTSEPEAAPILIQRAVQLPISGRVKQVSGPKTEVITDKDGGENAWVKIPDQVCTLVFETEGKSDRAVIRVWADKDNRFFVSSNKGDDSSPGTEAKPFKTLAYAFKQVKARPDKKGGIYIAGGDYDLGDDPFVLDYQVSLFGGFDENGWRRDPIITESVLLPHAFRENWINDITDRHKDLRRSDPRYHETILFRRTEKRVSTILLGGAGPGSIQTAGSPDTYVDGLTVFTPDEKNRSDTTTSIDSAAQNKRTVRNCIIIHVCGTGHNFLIATCGDGRFENNLVSGGIDSARGNTRPNITGTYGRWYNNLLLGPTGGSCTRIINCWGEGGTFIGNQVHGGESTGWTGMQAGHRATLADRVNVFRKNVFYLDYLFQHCMSTGLIMEDNEIHLFCGGVGADKERKFYASKALTIRNNHFYLAPGLTEDKIWPTEHVTKKLGGKFVFDKDQVDKERYIEPEGEGTGKPVIKDNTYTIMEKIDRRMGNLIDLKTLAAQGAKAGEDSYIRPKDPAKNLRAQASEKGTVSLTWDESADSDIAGYLVRYGQKSNSYQNPTFFEKVKSAEIKNLHPGEWYFTVVPIKAGNVECWKLSNEAQVAVK
jgi:hypothetical protein